MWLQPVLISQFIIFVCVCVILGQKKKTHIATKNQEHYGKKKQQNRKFKEKKSIYYAEY